MGRKKSNGNPSASAKPGSGAEVDAGTLLQYLAAATVRLEVSLSRIEQAIAAAQAVTPFPPRAARETHVGAREDTKATRAKVLQAVLAHPGIFRHQIERQIGNDMWAVLYALEMLRKQKLVRMQYAGTMTRYYPLEKKQ